MGICELLSDKEKLRFRHQLLKGSNKMKKDFLQKFKKMNLTVTEKMKNLIIEMLITKETLEEKNLTLREKKILEKYFKDLKR
jgi:hypothetical protein